MRREKDMKLEDARSSPSLSHTEVKLTPDFGDGDGGVDPD